jgi:hypothetical protein
LSLEVRGGVITVRVRFGCKVCDLRWRVHYCAVPVDFDGPCGVELSVLLKGAICLGSDLVMFHHSFEMTGSFVCVVNGGCDVYTQPRVLCVTVSWAFALLDNVC